MENGHLKKTLKPSAVFAIAFGSIIGFGCFVLPGDWLLDAGPLGATIAFVIATMMILVIAGSYGYMVDKLPLAGGSVVYAYKGLGRKHAFLCGWVLSLGFLSVVALNAMALPVLLRFVVPGLLNRGYLYTLAGYDIYIGEVLLSVSAILLFGYLNITGSEKIGKIQVLLVFLLFASVLLLAFGSFSNNTQGINQFKPFFAQDKTPLGAIFSVLAIAPMAFIGFDTIPHAAEEFNFSPRLASKIMFLSIIAGGIVYIIVLLTTAIVFPWDILNNAVPEWATGAAMQEIMGRIGLIILFLGVTMGIFTGINGFYLATSRLLFGMSKSRILPEWFSKIHPKYNTPVNALIFCMGIALIAPWFGRTAIIWIVDMCSAGAAISFFYTGYTAYQMSKREKAGILKQTMHLFSTVFSIGFIVMLLFPWSPAFMSMPALVAFLTWGVLGLLFYVYRAREYNAIPEDLMDRLVYGVNEENISEIT